MRSRFLLVTVLAGTTVAIPAAAWAVLSFEPAVHYPVENLPTSVAVGDINGDSVPDLATGHPDGKTVVIQLGNGDGTFDPAVSHPVGDIPVALAIGDVNGDGDADLATADSLGATVAVLLGDGGGTFTPAGSYATGNSPSMVAIGDLNGDGKPDLATPNLFSSTVTVLLGNGDGSFADALSHPPVGFQPEWVTIGDLNDDTEPDLAVTNGTGGTVSVLLGKGDGTFDPQVEYTAGESPRVVAIGDLNDDGKPDLATANAIGDNVSVLLGNGDGTFGAPAIFAAGDGARSVAIADFDGDGKPDLATANTITDDVSVLLGNGDGTFALANTHAVGDSPVSMVLSDLNGDGKPDLATANDVSDDVSVLLNNSGSEFATGPTASISGTARQGETLTADEGAPDPVPDELTYEWFADGVTIGGATAKTFELTTNEVGKKISVKITAKKAGYLDASDTSDETVPVEGIFTPGPTASISGLRRVGSTLTANTGSPSPTPDSFAYRWFMDGKLLGTKTKTLKLGAGTEGKRIQVKVYAIKAGYLTAADLSPATARISNLQAKTISMELNDYTVYRGQRVYAEIELLAPREPFSIVLDGTKLASGYANPRGVAVVGFTVPANATIGPRILRAYGKFPDRIDPDRITIR